MNAVTAPRTDQQPTSHRRQQFSLLLNRAEYIALDQLSASLGISKGATLRCAVKNLLNTKETGKVTTPIQFDAFWSTFRGN